MTDWYTDVAVLEAFPTAAGLSVSQLQHVADDASLIYGYTEANPGVADADLRLWALNNGITTDRLNQAMSLLRDAGKIMAMPSAGGAAAASAPRVPGPGPPAVPASALTVQELKKAAGRLNVAVNASATKDELAEAIATSTGLRLVQR